MAGLRAAIRLPTRVATPFALSCPVGECREQDGRNEQDDLTLSGGQAPF
jgi:hypothetical protein